MIINIVILLGREALEESTGTGIGTTIRRAEDQEIT